MNKYHSLRVKEVRKETEDAVSVSFVLPQDLSSDFDFEAGQYLNVRAQLNGSDVRRSYSICTSPNEDELRIAVKHVPGGKFSTFANKDLKAGDPIEVMPPQGKFTLKEGDDPEGLYVFFAAGSGITPVISLVKAILTQNDDSRVVLFYGNRTNDSIIFKEELEALKNRFLNRLSLHHIISRERQSVPLFDGRIDRKKCEHFARVFFDLNEVSRYFICGPEGMIMDLRDWLDDKEVDDGKVSYELFTTAGSPVRKAHEEQPGQQIDSSRESLVTVRIDGNAMDFPLTYGGQSILDAAIEAGADAPYSCKGGVCTTCKAMLLDGDVEMDVVYGLEPDEVDDGYILTCQAHPRTEKVLVDYDI